MAEQVVIPMSVDTAPIDQAANSVGKLTDKFKNLNETVTQNAGAEVLADMNKSLGENADAMENVSKKVLTLHEQKEELEQQLKKVTAEFGAESAQAKNLESSILGVSTKIRANTLEMRELTKAGASADRMMGFLRHTTMGAMGAWGGLSMAVAGGAEGHERAEKAMMKSMEIMQLMTAATEILTVIRESEGVKSILIGKLKTAGYVQEGAAVTWLTLLQGTLAAATSAAILPFVLLAGAAIGIITWFRSGSSASEEYAKKQEELKTANEQLTESMQKNKEAVRKLAEEEIKYLEAIGAPIKKIIEKKRELMVQDFWTAKAAVDNAESWLKGAQAAYIASGILVNGQIKYDKVLETQMKKRQKDFETAKENLASINTDIKSFDITSKKEEAKKDKEAAEKHKKKLEAQRKSNDDLAKLRIENITDQVTKDKAKAEEEAKEQIEGLAKDKNYADKKIEIQKQLQLKLAEIDRKATEEKNKKTAEIIKTDSEMKILLLKDSGASQMEVLKEQEDIEIKMAGDNALEKLKIMQKYDDLRVKLEKETNDKIAEANKKHAEEEKQALTKKLNDAKQIETSSIQLLTSIAKLEADQKMNQYNAEMQKLDEMHDRKVLNDKDYAAKKKQIDEKMKEERKKAAEEEKKIKLLQATSNLALSITKILAEGFKGDFGVSDAILIGLDTAIGVANIAQIASTPAFAKGTKNAPKGWKLVGEKGPELINDGGGYPIITHQDTRQILKKYDIPALNNTMFPGLESFQLNSGAIDEAIAGILSRRGGGIELDYDKLADKIGERVGQNVKIPVSKTVFDENGFTEYLDTGDSRRTFRHGRMGR